MQDTKSPTKLYLKLGNFWGVRTEHGGVDWIPDQSNRPPSEFTPCEAQYVLKRVSGSTIVTNADRSHSVDVKPEPVQHPKPVSNSIPNHPITQAATEQALNNNGFLYKPSTVLQKPLTSQLQAQGLSCAHTTIQEQSSQDDVVHLLEKSFLISKICDQSYSLWNFLTLPFPKIFSEKEIRAKAIEICKEREEPGDPSENDLIEAEKSLNKAHSKIVKKLRKLKPSPLKLFWQWTGFKRKKLWDFMQLLLVPIFFGIAGFLAQNWLASWQQALNDQSHAIDQVLSIDKERQDILSRYLDQMADSLKDGLLTAEPGTEKFIIAQARTVTVLQSLDKDRQRIVIQFLKSSKLNQPDRGHEVNGTEKDQIGKLRPLLHQAKMEYAQLPNSYLNSVSLDEADLTWANLGCKQQQDNKDYCSDWGGASLNKTSLLRANLTRILLKYAALKDSYFHETNFTKADLTASDFTGSDLTEANLSGAILLSTNLRNTTGLTQQQLEGEDPPLLCNAVLPKEISTDPNRDCDRMPEGLQKTYPERFTIYDAEVYINEARETKWD